MNSTKDTCSMVFSRGELYLLSTRYLTAGVKGEGAVKKKIQNTQEIKRTLSYWMKQDKVCKSLRKSSFSSYVQQKNKQFNLSCVSLVVGGWQKDKGKGRFEKENFLKNLHILSCFVQLKSVLLISCVFWVFFQNDGSQLCFRFFFPLK